MSSKLVKLKFHGSEWPIAQEWDLAVSSLGEAIRLIESNTKRLYSFLLSKEKQNIKYNVIINGRKFENANNLDINNPKTICESELCLKNKNLETIDIVPVLEGAEDVFTAILGVVLIIVGAITSNPALVIAGLTLTAAGVFSLLSRPPKFEDFREIEQGGKTSYLFAGPQNIIGEGGPVPVGYGRLLIGSQVISSSYVIRDFNASDTSQYIRDEFGGLTLIPKKQSKKKTSLGGLVYFN